MAREEIIIKQKEVENELNAMLDSAKYSKKKYFAAVKKFNDFQRELDILDGKTYTYEKWITKYSAKGETYKEARLNLVNKIKDLNGVEIDETDGRVTRVIVRTPYKVYEYEIHAHNFVEEIHTGTYEKGMFGKEVEVIEYKHYVAATIDYAGETWTWRY